MDETAFQARVVVCARKNGWRIDSADFYTKAPTPVHRFLLLVLGRTKAADLYKFVMKKRQSLFSLIYHTHDSRNSQQGYPDLTMVHPNRRQVIFAELKRVGGYRKKEQKLWQAGLMCALRDTPNVNYYLWDPRDWDSVVEALGGIDTGLLGRKTRKKS